MRKMLIKMFFCGICFIPYVHAQEVKPDSDLAFNVSAVSDYRYRGISQSRLKSAIQGGADYTNNTHGFYIGSWLSSIQWTKDAGGSGNLEADLYLGKRGEINSINYDVGVLTYLYPSNGLGSIPGFANANTTELYGQLSSGPFSMKYSRSTSNLFGFVDSKGSAYIDLVLNFPLEDGYSVNLHWGKQTVKNNSSYSYSDWKLSLSKEYVGINFSIAVLGTNANEKLYLTPNLKFTGKSGLVISAIKTF